MPWFQSSKQKQQRKIVQDKMHLCLSRPQKYQESLKMLDSYTRSSNQKVIEMIVDHVKETVKDEDVEPMRKYQAIQMLVDLMKSRNKPLGKYVVKKILKRLTLFAMHNKNSKDEDRGKNIFPKTKKSQQQYGAKFLTTLLIAMEDWGKNWPKVADGPYKQFQAAYQQLTMARVHFPKQKPKASPSPISRQISSPTTNKNLMMKNEQPKPSLNRISREKKRQIPKQALNHFQKMISCLQTLQNILTQNTEFNEMWEIIKQIVKQFKQTVQQGDGVIALLMNEGKQDIQVFEKIQESGNFVQKMQQDVKTIDLKNQKYNKFRDKYIKGSNKRIASYQIYFIGSSGTINKHNQKTMSNIPKQTPQSKIQEQQKKQVPKVRVPNRYDSTSNLQQQLQMGHIQINKQDFASNSHGSDHQSRYNSISGRIRTSFQQPKQSERGSNKDEQQKRQQKLDNKRQQGVVKEQQASKEQSKSQQKSHNKYQMSKISEKVLQSEGFNQFEIDNNAKTQNDNSGFGDFSVQKSNDNNSNSDFFKQIENKQKNRQNNDQKLVNMRAPRNKHKQPQQQFFDNSINPKGGSSSNFSAFDSRSKQRVQTNKKIQHKQPQKQANQNIQKQQFYFDTFKKPQILKQSLQQLKKQQKHEQSSQNPFSDKQENPFSQRDAKSQISNPFNTEEEANRSNITNPFSKKQISEKSFTKQNVTVNVNRQDINFQNKSQSSFFNKQPSNRSSNKSVTNPFETTTNNNDNPFQTNNNPFQTNNNPFQTTNQIQQDRDHSISKNRSFREARVQIQKSQSNFMQDPFDTKNDQKKGQVMDNDQKNVNNFLRESVQGFDLDDFNSVSDQNKSNDYNNQNNKSNDYNNQNIYNNNSKDSFDFIKNKQSIRDSWQQYPAAQTQHQKKIKNQSGDTFKQKKPSIQKKIQENSKKQFGFSDFDIGNNQSDKSSSKSDKKDNFFDSQFGPATNNNNNDNTGNNNKEQFGFSDFDFDKQKSQLSRKSSVQNPFENFAKSQSNNNSQSYQFNNHKSKPKHQIQGQQFGWDQFGKQQQNQSKYQPSQSSDSRNQIQPIIINKQNVIDHQNINKSDNRLWWKDQSKSSSQNSSQKYPQQQSKIIDNQDVVSNSQMNQISRNIVQHYKNNQEKLDTKKTDKISYHIASSPFQKKQMPWSYQLSTQKQIDKDNAKTSRYHSQNDKIKALNIKKQQLKLIAQYNKKKLQHLASLKQKLTKTRQIYQQQLKQVQRAKLQRDTYRNMLCQLQDNNSKKQKQIQELIKKTKKAESIKQKILEKEKLLYQYVKQQKIRQQQCYMSINQLNGKSNGYNQSKKVNKWDRFNANLKKIKQQQQCYQQYRNQQYLINFDKKSEKYVPYLRSQQKSIYF